MGSTTFLEYARTLSYQGRVVAAIALGQRARDGEAAARATLAELAEGPTFGRHLAAHALHGTRDGDAVVRALSDASRLVRSAARPAISACDDVQAGEALRVAATIGEHPRLLRRLARKKRFGVIDGFLAERARAGAMDAGPLFRFGSALGRERYAKEALAAEGGATATEWELLVADHPRAATDRLLALVTEAGPLPDRIAERRLVRALERLATVEPAAVLGAIARALELRVGFGSALDLVAETDVEAAVEFAFRKRLAAPQGAERYLTTLSTAEMKERLEASPAFVPRLETVLWLRSKEDAIALFRRRRTLLPRPQDTENLFQELLWAHDLGMRDEREEIWKEWAPRSRRDQGCTPPSEIARLPFDLAQREIAHALDDVPAVRSDARLLTAYASLLPHDKLEGVLDPLVKHPDADVRSAALATIVRLAASPEARSRALLRIAARPNERDPVRAALLAHAGGWKPPLFRSEDGEALGAIVTAALNARDLSAESLSHLSKLVFEALPVLPEWAAEAVLRIAKARGTFSFAAARAVVERTANWANHPLDAPIARIAHGLRTMRDRTGFLALVGAAGLAREQDLARPGFWRAIAFPRVEAEVAAAVKESSTEGALVAIANEWRRPEPTLDAALLGWITNPAAKDHAIVLAALTRHPTFDQACILARRTWPAASLPGRVAGVLFASPPKSPGLFELLASAVHAVLQRREGDRAVGSLFAQMRRIDPVAAERSGESLILDAFRRGEIVEACRLAGEVGTVTPAVLSAAGRALTPSTPDEAVGPLLTLLSRHDPPRFREIALGFVAAEPSAAYLQPLVELLAARHQDHLDPRILDASLPGRFAPENARNLPPARTFYRLTDVQQQAIARGLRSRIAADHDASAMDWVATAACLPAAPETALEAAASDRIPVRDAGLSALGRLDGATGVPFLLTCLDDDRARIAAYALRAILSRVPPDVALRALAQAPLEKVSASKEIIRIAGTLKTKESTRFLVRLAAQKLHRDVRIALVRALWDHLGDADAWRVIEETAEHPDEHVASALLDLPIAEMPDSVDARFAEVIARLVRHPHRDVRLRVLRAPPILRDRRRRVIDLLLEAIAQAPLDEAPLAAASLLGRAEEADVGRIVAAVPSALADVKRLLVWVRALSASSGARTARRIADAFLRGLVDPKWRALRMQLGTAFWRGAELSQEIERLASTGGLDIETFPIVRAAVSQTSDLQRLDAEVARWSASPEMPLRRLALVALVAAARAGGWSDERVAALTRLENDGSPLVSGASAVVRAGGST